MARNPDKKHFVELEILYQMLFSRVSVDKISKRYGHLKILFKIFYFHFSRYRFHSLPVRKLLTSSGTAKPGSRSIGIGKI